jgi:hypothetical protein
MVGNDNHPRQLNNQELIARQIEQNLVTQCEAEIQQLYTRNQETTTASITYQDRMTTL